MKSDGLPEIMAVLENTDSQGHSMKAVFRLARTWKQLFQNCVTLLSIQERSRGSVWLWEGWTSLHCIWELRATGGDMSTPVNWAYDTES